MVQRTNAAPCVRVSGGHESASVMKGEVVSSILTDSTTRAEARRILELD